MQALEVLYEKEGLPSAPLPAGLSELYGGDAGFAGPRVYANFVSSLDGIVALAEPGVSSGSAISGRSEADRFVMGLLRALAGAVLVGAGTLRDDPGHLWRPSYIHPPSSALFADLRRRLGLPEEPLLAIVTASGALDPGERALSEGALVLTSQAGAARLRGILPGAAEVVGLPGEEGRIALRDAVSELRSRGHETILTEGGPHVIGELLRESLLDELFLTLSPVLAGRAQGRLGLVEGIELLPAAGAWAELASLRRHGSHLFLRYVLREASETEGRG